MADSEAVEHALATGLADNAVEHRHAVLPAEELRRITSKLRRSTPSGERAIMRQPPTQKR